MKNLTTLDLKEILSDGCTLRLNAKAVRSMIETNESGQFKRPSLAWLWNCATEVGNSEAIVTIKDEYGKDGNRRIFHFDFHQMGTCSLGIVFFVRFTCTEDKLSDFIKEKVEECDWLSGHINGVYPEHIIKELGGFISIDNLDHATIEYDEGVDEEAESEEG